jgi:hypothetical protein
MYSYVNNNPVMLTDSTGYAPEWFNNIKDSIVDWLTTVPDRDETFQNKTGLLGMIGSVILGTGIGIGADFMSSIARNITPIRGNPRTGMSKFLKGVGITITVFATARTVGNLWFADNGFTNAERLSLISVEIAGTIAVTLAVSMLSAAVVAAGIISTPVLVAGVAVVAIGAAVYYGTDALYNYCETN